MKKVKTQIRLSLQLIDEAFKSKAWHGTNLHGSIRGLSAQQAAWRPKSTRHNIWEIVVHCAYWKYIVWRLLSQEKKGSFLLKGSNWFKCKKNLDEKTWRETLKLLDETHKSMCEVISQLKPSSITQKPKGSKFTILSAISGIACHDIYHAGQIQLLKRLMKR